MRRGHKHAKVWSGTKLPAGSLEQRLAMLADRPPVHNRSHSAVSFTDAAPVHPGWPAAQAQNWWQAPVSALSYNDNVVLVRATGVRPGAPALLGFYPAPPSLLSIVGRVLTTPGSGAMVGVRRT